MVSAVLKAIVGVREMAPSCVAGKELGPSRAAGPSSDTEDSVLFFLHVGGQFS